MPGRQGLSTALVCTRETIKDILSKLQGQEDTGFKGNTRLLEWGVMEDSGNWVGDMGSV